MLQTFCYHAIYFCLIFLLLPRNLPQRRHSAANINRDRDIERERERGAEMEMQTARESHILYTQTDIYSKGSKPHTFEKKDVQF